jgi:hypothetical protein
MKEIYSFLGITDDEFRNKIKPYLDSIVKKGGPIDLILLKINTYESLGNLGKIYCAYEVGRVMGKSRR